MKRVWGRVLAGVSLLAGACVMVPGCVHDDSTLFVQTVLAPQLVTPGQLCVYTSNPSQESLSSGLLDVGVRSEYDPTYLVGNQMVAQVNSQQLQTETSIITIQGAVVRITDAGGNPLKTYTRLSSATVYPASGATPGYTPIAVTAIDEDTATSAVAGLAAGGTVRLVSYVKFFGNTLGGTSVESDEFEFPVDLCVGCLVTISAGDDNLNTVYPQPNCLGSGTPSTLPTPCVPGQDLEIDCSQCPGHAVCDFAVTGGTGVADAGGG